MLIIACMNGAFGFDWMKRVKKRDYMSDVVHDCLIFDNDNRYEAFVNGETREYSVRGSLMYLPAMRNFILKHNKPENNLLMIGKSKGGYWMNELAKELESKLKYSQKRFILVDTCWLGRNKRNIVPPPTFNMCYNLYQQNERFLNGAWWTYADSIILGQPDGNPKIFKQMDLTRPGVDHWTIIHAPEVKQAIRESMEVMI